ncbi:MAG: HlyD family efflux transporter periplasmic adaptor subunit [Planctomycetaceae bacterium]|nr:HlyD family efflux transporter periplasmic adaptor subunit [Planctomycetaceae bacterium]
MKPHYFQRYVGRSRRFLSRWFRPREVACLLLLVPAVLFQTGAVDQKVAPVEVDITELQPSVFIQSIERKGLTEPLQTTEVRSECYWSTRILSLVPEGTWVQKGDVVCVLDSSEIEEYARAREIYLIRYRGRLDNALHEEEMLESQNARRLEAARFSLEKAESDLETYSEGTFPQQLEELEDNLAMLAEQTRSAEDRLDYVEHLWAMGLINQREMQTEAFKTLTAEQKLARASARLHSIERFLHPQTELRLTHQRDQAERNLARTQISNGLSATRARLTTLAYERTLGIYERYHRRATESIKACTLRAPCDGQVMHGNSWYLQSRGIRQIEEGKTVRLQQKIFEIPDPQRMKVSVPLEESLIYHVHKGMPVTVIIPGHDNMEVSGRVFDISRYPRVRSSYTPHLKDYWLDIELLPTDEQRGSLTLKTDVVVQMKVAEIPDSLLIPRDAVTGAAGHNFVYVFDGRQLVPRRVELGEANETSVCVKEGLQCGDRLVTTMTPQHREALLKTLRVDLGIEGQEL